MIPKMITADTQLAFLACLAVVAITAPNPNPYSISFLLCSGERSQSLPVNNTEPCLEYNSKLPDAENHSLGVSLSEFSDY